MSRAKVTIRDGKPVFIGTCPRCGEEQDLDQDQLGGKVSSQCSTPGCGWHETVVWELERS